MNVLFFRILVESTTTLPSTSTTTWSENAHSPTKPGRSRRTEWEFCAFTSVPATVDYCSQESQLTAAAVAGHEHTQEQSESYGGLHQAEATGSGSSSGSAWSTAAAWNATAARSTRPIGSRSGHDLSTSTAHANGWAAPSNGG